MHFFPKKERLKIEKDLLNCAFKASRLFDSAVVFISYFLLFSVLFFGISLSYTILSGLYNLVTLPIISSLTVR